MAEQGICNAQVGGSSPLSGSCAIFFTIKQIIEKGNQKLLK